jgi:TRAP-type mannitol/chloroaromatic compound transport system permease large subunit
MVGAAAAATLQVVVPRSLLLAVADQTLGEAVEEPGQQPPAAEPGPAS